MRILISGASGLIGKALFTHFSQKGHDVVPLSRHPTQNGIYWNPKTGDLKKEDFEGFDAIFHLAGKNIAGGLWTKKVKEEIFLSRCRDTWLLSQVLVRLLHPPKTLIVASAVGIYGDRGGETLTESSPPGCGFLAEVCKKWEEATKSIENRGVRTVHTRFGVVLSPNGGMLRRLLPLFRMGLGAVVGSGDQFVSWVALEDLATAFSHILEKDSIQGPVNVVSPHPEKMADFAKKLAKGLHRPLFLKIGEKPLKWLLGQMAEEMLLASTKALPEKLEASGFTFQYPTLESYFKALFS